MVNLRPLTAHIMPSYTHKMADVSWPQIMWRYFVLCITMLLTEANYAFVGWLVPSTVNNLLYCGETDTCVFNTGSEPCSCGRDMNVLIAGVLDMLFCLALYSDPWLVSQLDPVVVLSLQMTALVTKLIDHSVSVLIAMQTLRCGLLLHM